MISKLLWLILCLFQVALFVVPAWCEEGGGSRTIMQPDRETLQRWIDDYENASVAYIDRPLYFSIPLKGSLSLLSRLEYTPSERDQGLCGNCWVWAGSGVMGIALDVQADVFDRLSVQYVNSCFETRYPCCGGTLQYFVDYYELSGKSIPWSAQNGSWQDGSKECSSVSSDIPCSAISISKRYPIKSITTGRIETQGVGQEEAISNIKNVLNQNKAVFFAFYMATQDDWRNFQNFWGNRGEEDVWNPDFSCGHIWKGGGAHAVLCVGYNDDDPNAAYWIMLNSWGTSGGGRPDGTFRMDMNMNYDCRFYNAGFPEYSFQWQTLDIAFGNVPAATTGSAGPVTSISATLNGTVNPGMVSTAYFFEYGTSTAYGQTTEIKSAGSGSSDLPVSATITGLSINTTYHYRLTAENSDGTSYGEDSVFATLPLPPTVTTGEAGSVTSSSAILNGMVNPSSASTNYFFEYGTSTAYGLTTETKSAGSGSSDLSVSATITGLSVNTTYHYRLTAENRGGPSYGEDRSLTTGSSSGGEGGGGGCFVGTAANSLK